MRYFLIVVVGIMLAGLFPPVQSGADNVPLQAFSSYAINHEAETYERAQNIEKCCAGICLCAFYACASCYSLLPSEMAVSVMIWQKADFNTARHAVILLDHQWRLERPPRV